VNDNGKKEVNYIELLVIVAAQQKEEIQLLKEQNKILENRVTELERTTKKKNVWKSQQAIISLP
jgi:hypothetical protein